MASSCSTGLAKAPAPASLTLDRVTEMTILEQIQADTKDALRAGEKERVTALRMVTSALQLDAKEGDGDELAVLRRERKRRREAATAYRDGGSADRAASEEREAELIERYLPAELSDDALAQIVAEALDGAGISEMSKMGPAMGAVMKQVDGRADGGRVSAAVRAHLQRG